MGSANGLFCNRGLKRRSISVLICLFLIAIIANAQIANVVVSGTVKDETGAVIPGVSVTITNTQTGLVKTMVTGEDGRYSVLSMPSGTYDVPAELPGFATSIQRNREFLVGTNVTLDIIMKVASGNETVERSEEHTSELQSHS